MKNYLILLLFWCWSAQGQTDMKVTTSHGAVIRGDSSQKNIALVFTGHEFAEGGEDILNTLESSGTKASFFFTGDFYRNKDFQDLVRSLKVAGNYLGAHSDRHLLYCDWSNRDSLLVDKNTFIEDVKANYKEMAKFGIEKEQAKYYLPPYEWYNDSISHWTGEMELQLVNFTPGTRSNADYTTAGMPNYVDSETIFQSIVGYEEKVTNGLNGFILLLHLGAGPLRPDKFHDRLPELIQILKGKGYTFVTIDQLLGNRIKY